ncbi:replication-relaxation family protein [Desmospora activa]|uniref:Protein involved in plasmid replication-relaxation n=1 Tax=Desmospora activa DSM 45169 TaxID=1121389 RepID=A0A2T4YYZ8_9BACL|nr:replication-relaxation family protein [Desmospora activa]PTM52173.1 protein involved in plasmid replication-relaxation [Desmospora activa DSM 45169]
MIVDLLFHPDYTKKEKLLWALFTFGMADRHHLAQTLNCSVHNIDRMIKEWNRKLPPTDRFILARRPSRDQPRMYYLGSRGWTLVMEWMEESRRYYGKKKKRAGHYRGLTDIFLRLVQRIGYDHLPDRLIWQSDYEAWETICYPWRLANSERWKDPRVREEEQQLLTRPDARVIVDGYAYWVEYDHDTKREAPMKEQFGRYIESLAYLPSYVDVHHPVVWVVPTEKRRHDLKSWWSTVKREPDYQDLEYKPEMRFFLEGEETSFFLRENIRQTG